MITIWRLCRTIVAALSLSVAAAQGLQGGALVGVITSSTVGALPTPLTRAGEAQRLTAVDWAAAVNNAGGVFGVPVKLIISNDGGTISGAVSAAREAIEGGALLLVCCTIPAASNAVAAVAESAGITLLSPTSLGALPGVTEPYWSFSFAPSDTDALSAIVAHAYHDGRSSLALLALDGSLGETAEADLIALLAVVGMRLSHSSRYPAGERELRPAALLTASTQPGGVVVWGFPDDLVTAFTALRQRGYEGPVYARSDLLAPGSALLSPAQLAGVRFAVAPALVANESPLTPTRVDPYSVALSSEPGTVVCAAEAAFDRNRLGSVTGAAAQLPATVPLLGSLDVLRDGLEQLIALQLPTEDVAVLRQALRDTLVGLGPRCSGAGLLDLQDGRRSALLPRGLVVGALGPAGLEVAP